MFSGGIGENSPSIRSRIYEGLEFIGVKLYEKRNKNNTSIISSDDSQVTVRMIHTSEERMIAKSVFQLLKNKYQIICTFIIILLIINIQVALKGMRF